MMDDLISRQNAIEVVNAVWSVTGDVNVAKVWDQIKDLPSAQTEKRTKERTETHSVCLDVSDTNVGDTISRQAAIDVLCKMRCGCSLSSCPLTLEEDGTEECADVRWLTSLPSAQPEQRWIPCGERLPRQGQEVICQCRANMINVLKLDAYGDWYQDAEHCYMSGFVIAWMPLPEPWKGEEDENS